MKNDSIIQFEGYNYKIIKDHILTNGQISIVTTQKTYSSYLFSQPVFSAGGEISFEKNSISINDSNISISDFFPKYIKMISYKHISNEAENDLSFLERGKSLIQSMGYSNNKKIENILLEDKRIKSVVVYNSNGITNFTIFPSSFSELDDVINYSNEVIQYYQSSNYNVLKPNLIEINIKGLKIQLMHLSEYNKIISLFIQEVKEYLSNSLINNKIKRSEIINILSNILSTYNISVNFNTIYIYNYFYWNSSYEDPISINEIKDELDIGDNNMITLSTVE